MTTMSQHLQVDRMRDTIFVVNMLVFPSDLKVLCSSSRSGLEISVLRCNFSKTCLQTASFWVGVASEIVHTI